MITYFTCVEFSSAFMTYTVDDCKIQYKKETKISTKGGGLPTK